VRDGKTSGHPHAAVGNSNKMAIPKQPKPNDNRFIHAHPQLFHKPSSSWVPEAIPATLPMLALSIG